jgi:3',5'-cyclic AMP phosphodiesterase CpdA
MVTVVHISDLHCGESASAKFESAAAAINALRPDCIVVTGDVTHSGRRREFQIAASFFAALNAPIVGAPGNHDAPVFNPLARALAPFARFSGLGLLEGWDSSCGLVGVRAYNSARAVQTRLDWSQGVYAGADIHALSLSFNPRSRHRIIACHHPPHAPASSPLPVETRGAEAALSLLSDRYLFLCGHLHSSADFLAFGRPHLEVSTAPTLASSRERGQGPGFRVRRFDATQRTEDWLWDGSRYTPQANALAVKAAG